MTQSKRMSVVEAITNTTLGYVVPHLTHWLRMSPPLPAKCSPLRRVEPTSPIEAGTGPSTPHPPQRLGELCLRSHGRSI
jgi:hypothetical protein